MTARVIVPRALVADTGGRRDVTAAGTTVGEVLDGLAAEFPRLGRRLRDETGTLRRYVNVYVDGADVRTLDGLATPVTEGGTVHILPSVAGG